MASQIKAPERTVTARTGERGHLLVGLVVLLACMLIMLTAAAQSWTFLVRRDREAELIQRGEEYARAIAFYHKEVGAYPLKLDLLAEKGPHGHRFIRKLYKDPLADDGEWGLLFLSPTGQGFINPYATQLGEGFGGDLSQDPLGGIVAGRGGIGAGGGGIGGGFGNAGGFGNKKGSGKTGFGRSNRKDAQAPGYSELDPESLKAFEGAVMPIVGVVHKKEEWGVKYYKGQATLNDWAFTEIDQGGQHQAGGKRQAPMPKTGPRFGIGDSHQPIFLPGSRSAPPRGKPPRDQRREDLKAYQEDQNTQQRHLEGDFEEDEDTGDEEGVEEGEQGEEGSDADPNGGSEDADPNGSEDADPNSGDDDDGEDEDPNGNGA